MIVCELESGWAQPDPTNPDYSLAELDVYAHAPGLPFDEQHRLSIRKNLAKGVWEVYRRMRARERDVVAFYGSLNEALRFAETEWRLRWVYHTPPGAHCWSVAACDHRAHREVTRTDDETVVLEVAAP